MRRIRPNPPKLKPRHISLFHLSDPLTVQADLLDRTAAVNEQDFLAELCDLLAQMMKLMNSLGYDMSKVYNVGGMGQFTDSKFAPYTTDNAEIVLEATYSFEGLTPATK